MIRDQAIYRENPGLKNQMHCIVYVIKADRQDLKDDEEIAAYFKEIADVRKEFTPYSKLHFLDSDCMGY